MNPWQDIFQKTNKMFVSVVICTYNRAELLQCALESMEKQTAGSGEFEVIVVNNNCMDKTFEIVSEFIDRNKNIRMVMEPRQGLSYARNRGYKESRGVYVAYLDDDARASQGWVKEILGFIERSPDAVAFGGPYYGYSLKPLPEWLPPEYGTSTQGKEERIVTLLSGSNMVFRKALLEKYSGFDTKLGMKDDVPGYGEETDLFLKLKKDGADVYYVPTVHVEHLIEEKKFSLFWNLKAYYYIGRVDGRLFDRRGDFLYKSLCLAKGVLRGLFLLFYQKPMPMKRRIYYAMCPFMCSLGSFVKCIEEKKCLI